MARLALSLCALLGATSAYQFAVDISQAGSDSQFSCLYQNGYSTAFVRAYTPTGSGSVDYNAANSIKTAYKYRLGTEAFITPQPQGGKSAATQVDETVAALRNAGISLRSLWLQVTSPVNWPSAQASNVNFISQALSRISSYGISPGVYTNAYDWNQITNNAYNLGVATPMLWYWNVYSSGPSGESPANFNDFRAFGPFQAAAVKQYGQAENICNFAANRDVYGSASALTASATASGLPLPIKRTEPAVPRALPAGEKVVVGGIGL